MNKTVRNERRKLTASWFSAISTALIAAGAIAPAASRIFGFSSNPVDQTLLLTSSSLCLALSAGLHMAGRLLLEVSRNDAV